MLNSESRIAYIVHFYGNLLKYIFPNVGSKALSLPKYFNINCIKE